MRNPQLFYQRSGGFSPLIIFTPILTIPVSIILGYIYAYASVYIPIVGIVTVILLGGFALLTGLMSYLLLMYTNVRNSLITYAFGLFGGFVALYASWVTFLCVMLGRYGGEDPPGFMDFIFNPLGMWSVAMAVSETGWFSIGRGSGSNVSGWFLLIIWAIEAIVILIGPIWGARMILGDVFCETCGKWTDETKGLLAFDSGSVRTRVAKIEERGASEIMDLPGSNEKRNEFCRVDASVCQQCNNLHVISLTNVTITHDKDGKPEEKEKSLVEHMIVSKEQYDALVNRATSELTEDAEELPEADQDTDGLAEA